jgi:biofilm PGA synthesis N-glycosyltransferase PgaC
LSEPSYALVTPARDEAEHLPRLAEAVAAQTVAPTLWVVVDDGSTDGTRAFVEQLAGDSKLIRMIVAPRDARSEWNAVPSGRRSGRDVIAFQAGVESLGALPDLVVKLDADISFECDFFERVLEQFARDPRLGIASGTCFERVNGAWTQRHVTEAHVWGATQVYRRECLDAVFPLELRLGWDGIDLLRAELAGWRTRTLIDVPFRHHRLEGVREGSRANSWLAEGWCA